MELKGLLRIWDLFKSGAGVDRIEVPTVEVPTGDRTQITGFKVLCPNH